MGGGRTAVPIDTSTGMHWGVLLSCTQVRPFMVTVMEASLALLALVMPRPRMGPSADSASRALTVRRPGIMSKSDAVVPSMLAVM